MALSSKVVKRPGSSSWVVRQVVPPDVRHIIPAPWDKRISLKTADESQARRLALPIIEKLEAKIAAARAEAAKPQLAPLTIQAGVEAVEEWLVDIRAGHHPKWWWGCDTAAADTDVLRQMSQPWEAIPDREYLLDDILAAKGLTSCHVVHEYMMGPLWKAFAHAYIEAHDQQHKAYTAELQAAGEFERIDEALARALEPDQRRMRITELSERFIVTEQPTDAANVRNYIKRLAEELGDKAIQAVTSEDMAAFLVRLRDFPIVTTQSWKDTLTFDQILEMFEDDEDVPRIGGKTIRTKWFSAYNRVFGFAERLDLISRNPVKSVLPPKRLDGTIERRPFSAEEIERLFSAPNFTGHTGEAMGYRKDRGEVVTKDARYWLPIVALFTGARMAEIADAKVADVKLVDGVRVLDLTARKLKTKQSRRLVPLHSGLKDAGFIAYVEGVQAAGEEWLFPDLHNGQGSAKQFGKWWALWMGANGFDDPALTFHTFRHTFKRACRNAKIIEETHDILTGHAGRVSVGREYGLGMDVVPLSEAIETVKFPTFPTKGLTVAAA